ncbi:oligosaccharide flippase family protein [Geotalea toluenoxydans]|uniref:oligosaccharide flippase family protein n=1 Tax=Geotalea toluenoxydans TaxID=421624 RepID=UPI002436B829|nr:polysaccharide biosynthesis C-terminal domain-containing protein [Geotalea toluenoxydans]
MSVKYFDKPNSGLSRYIGNAFLLLVISTIIVSLGIWISAGFISRHTMFPCGSLWAIVVFSMCQFIILVMMTLWQVESNALKYSLFQNLQTIVNISLSLLFVVTLGMNWKGRIYAQIITVIVFAFIGAYILLRSKRIVFKYDKTDIAHALKFGVPLIPHALGGMLIAQTDRIFITNMIGVSETGIYTVGFQIGMILQLLASSFNNAYVPWLYNKLSENKMITKIKIVKFTYVYFIVTLLIAAFIALVSPWFLSYFVGSKFSGAYQYTTWIVFGFAFCAMYYMVTNYIFYANKTHVLSLVTFFTALLNVALNYVLIKRNGAIGAAQASALAFFVSFILTWVISARVYKMPWNIFDVSLSNT